MVLSTQDQPGILQSSNLLHTDWVLAARQLSTLGSQALLSQPLHYTPTPSDESRGLCTGERTLASCLLTHNYR